MRRAKSTRIKATLLAGLASAVLITSCSSHKATPASVGGATSAASGSVKLSFWSWAPKIDEVVALWNKSHPDIQVSVSNQAQGDAQVTKLLTADKAGNGPDLAQAEYQALPALITAGVAADITKSAATVKQHFTDATWNLTTFSDTVYSIPQDIAPMMMFYRTDLFTQYGLTVPKTWDEFAAEAKTLHTKAPTKFLTTFSSADPGWFAGLSQQAGAKWWDVNADKWTVKVNDAATAKVANYWSGLVSQGVVQGQPMYTPQWNKAMADGTLLAWPTAVWGSGVLEGIAPATKGKWAMAPLPAWTAGEAKAGYWGGSSTMVLAKSKHQAAAAEFANWLNTDDTAVSALIKTSALYPASIEGQKSPALAQAPAFLPNQPDFYSSAASIASTASGFTWGPDVNVAYGAYKDAFAKAIQSKSYDFSAALSTIQDATVSDMKKSGFKLTQ